MTTFLFKEYGDNLGTRILGEQVRLKLLPIILESEEKVVLDFSGVNIVGNAFADECIGKLLLTMSLSELKSKTTFSGLNDLARLNIAIALRRRLMA